jgi:hypothetical protein
MARVLHSVGNDDDLNRVGSSSIFIVRASAIVWTSRISWSKSTMFTVSRPGCSAWSAIIAVSPPIMSSRMVAIDPLRSMTRSSAL